MFFILALIMGISCSVITIRTLVSYTEIKLVWKIIISSLVVVGWLSPFIIALVRRSSLLTGGAFVVFTQIAYFLFGLGFILFCLLIFRDAVWFSVYHVSRWMGKTVEAFDPMNAVLLKKANITVCVLSVVIALYAVYEGTKMPAVKRVNIETPKITEPFTIAVLSDLHINSVTPVSRVVKIVKEANSLSPDIIVLPGDVIDDTPEALSLQMDALAELKAKYGVYVTLGNHEFYVGSMDWEKKFRQMKLKYMGNDGDMLDEANVYVAGIPDSRMLNVNKGMLESVYSVLEQRKSGAYTVFLSHSPDFVRHLDKDKVDLQISGHTHGGQIFPFHLIVKKANGFLAGLYRLEEGMMLYVSRGAGGWGPPMRLLAPSEITFITLLPSKV